jgi:TPR repeat protein
MVSPPADQGHASGQVNLGWMYSKGLGVPQDYVGAHMWFSLSAAQGNQNAVKNREVVAQRMTPAQIGEAHKRAAQWQPSQPAPVVPAPVAPSRPPVTPAPSVGTTACQRYPNLC